MARPIARLLDGAWARYAPPPDPLLVSLYAAHGRLCEQARADAPTERGRSGEELTARQLLSAHFRHWDEYDHSDKDGGRIASHRMTHLGASALTPE